ncbi:MAG: dehydrogenase [Gammaproteobacteria bacterium]|nr:MAG: dehydrogenase [Gammaproteobacteria bacterium]
MITAHLPTLRKIIPALLISLCALSPLETFASITGTSEGMKFKVEKIASGLGVVWGLALLNQKEMLLTERSGEIKRLNLNTGKIQSLQGAAKVRAAGQGGLMDVAVQAPFQAEDWVYFTYTKDQKGKGATTLARAHLEANKLTDWTDLIVTKSITSTNRHFGSRIAFDGLGHVFFSVGDRGVRRNAQDLAVHAGSILRVNTDGTVPTDNPFINDKTAQPEIWSYGHRNPQGINFDTASGELWVIEHGPRGGDEINQITKGSNYGWATVSFGKEYWGPIAVGEGTQRKGMENPTKVYIPSIAPGSLVKYTGHAFPEWQGNLISGALKLTHLNRVVLDKNNQAIKEERLLEGLGLRIRALIESPEGWLYFSTDLGDIYRLSPNS